MKKNYRFRKTISMKQFISEMGENFSSHMKKKLLELEIRSVLTRIDNSQSFDIKHVEHTKHECNFIPEGNTKVCLKEYVYGRFIVNDGALYFSENCDDNSEMMQAPIINEIYDSIKCDEIILDNAKKIDDSNIDNFMDSILAIFPEVSQSYIDIMSKYNIFDNHAGDKIKH